MADYITTFSKIHFTPLEPKKEEILPEDIAHPLSMMTRANGHFPEFYSVGQHSIQCAKEARARGYCDRLVLACLIHDGSEAYLSDITRPVKKNMPVYRKIEKVLQDAIYEKFLGSVPTEEEMEKIRDVDDTCLYDEFYHFTGERLNMNPGKLYSNPDYRQRAFRDVEKEFLDLMKRCLGKLECCD